MGENTIIKGIRGAITVEENSVEAIREGTLTLIDEMLAKNNIDISKISHVIFTVTSDLTKAFPAKFARTERGFKDTAMMCFNEANIENALQKCIRILIVINCEESFIPQFVYLRGAQNLRG